MKWSEALPKIVHDKRYRALRKLEDRKTVFEEFLIKKKELERVGLHWTILKTDLARRKNVLLGKKPKLNLWICYKERQLST